MTWFWGYNDILRQEPITLAYCLRLRQFSGLYLWLVVTWADLFLVLSFDLIQRRIQGRASPPPYFSTKMTPEGSKKIFWRPPPTPTYLRVWMTAPPPSLSDALDPPLWLKIVRNWNTVQLNTTRITERILSRLSDLYILTLTTNEGQLGRVSQILLTTISGQFHSAFWLEDNDKTEHI